MIGKYLLLIFGVFCCSTAVLVLKSTEAHPMLVGTYRLLLAAFLLSPVFYRDWKRHKDKIKTSDLLRLVLPAFFLATHFASWALGARLTLVANASLIINLAPIVMPIFAFALVRERITRIEILGTMIAIGGVILLSWHDFSAGGENMTGNIVCFLSMLAFTAYLAFGLRGAKLPTVWLYVVPLYAIAGVMSLVVSFFVLDSIAVVKPVEIGRIVILAIVPTILGHSILNHSLKRLKGQVVSVVNLHQFVFATITAFFVYGEVPSWYFIVAAMMCSFGAFIVVRESEKAKVAASLLED